MPTWGQILQELRPQGGKVDFDGVRRKYLANLNKLTGRAVVLYSTAFLEGRPIPPIDLQIHLGDIQGLMEVASNIEEREVDLILHSPGGSAEAAEAIVHYLRTRFDHIRVFVPLAAMSAATMLALSADEIVMGDHSQLGPTDPQFNIVTPEGPRSAPAQAILDQFELAKEDCKTPENLAAWIPILRTYAPGLLVQCRDSAALSVQMVSQWLERYMFRNNSDASKKAQMIAAWFADYKSFQSHGRRVGPDDARSVGLVVHKLEDDAALQDAVLSVHHATVHTFTGTGAAKIIENHHGRAFVKITRQELVLAAPQPAPPQPTPQPQPAPALPRSERRRRQRGR
jgi:hypothetical protein